MKVLLLYSFLLMSSNVMARYCETSYTPMGESNKMWESEEPVSLSRSNKNTLTYSFDGELTYYELLGYFKDDASILEKINKIFPEEYTKKELVEMLKVTDKQFDFFVIRKGTDLAKKKKWTLADLPPKYFAYGIESLQLYRNGSVPAELKKMISLVQTQMRKRSFPVLAHNDGGFVEIVHESFEEIPKKYHDMMFELDKHFPDSNMHMHLGIPNENVTDKAMIAIANYSEAQVVFNLLLNGFEQKLPYVGSTIGKQGFDGFKFSDRGPVKLGLDEFSDGTVHDLEFRQYGSIEEGLDLVAFASHLAKNSKKLNFIKVPQSKYFSHPSFGNVAGSLDVVAALFESSGENQLKKWAREMRNFAQKTNKESIDPKVIEEIQKFLNKNDIQKTLRKREDLFLK